VGKIKKGKSRAGKNRPRTRPYPYEFRLKMVRLHLEEGYSKTVLKEQFGISKHSIGRWINIYRQEGAEKLVPKQRSGVKRRMNEEVKGRIVGMKKKHPEYGPRRIADVLKRFFLVSASASAVHKTLSEITRDLIRASAAYVRPTGFSRSSMS